MPDGRAVLNTLIQGATVDLFHGLGVAVAPIPNCRQVPTSLSQYIAGSIVLSGNGIQGALTLLVPEDVLKSIQQPGVRPPNFVDWVRELTNQLTGRLRNRLTSYQVTLRPTLPVGMRGTSLERRSTEQPSAVYGFKALRGEIVVTLSGTIDCSAIAYSGVETLAHEGDIILF